MFPTLVAVRNGRVVAMVTSPRIGATLTGATTMAVGLAPQALVLAAQAMVEGRPAITYSVMTRERTAKFAVQPIQLEGEQLRFAEPVDGGTPQDPTIMQALAEALAQRPIDSTTVSRRDRSGVFGQDPFLAPEQGRVVIDAGTVKTLHERVEGIHGQALYVARSREAGRLALEAGLPRVCLLQPEA